MYNFFKKIYTYSPNTIQSILVSVREYYGFLKAKKSYPVFDWTPGDIGTSVDIESGTIEDVSSKNSTPKKINVLFYHVSGLSFAGTEKFLQIIAKYLNKEKYNVYYMYSSKPRGTTGNIKLDGRISYLKEHTHLVEFDYSDISNAYPYVLNGMNPTIFEVIKQKEIDVLFTAGSGYSEFPFNLITKLPIILINIFGVANTQKNICSNICISKAVEQKIAHIVPIEKRTTIYIQSEQPKEEYKILGRELRKRLGITATDVVFGRIGRADDNIFDPIGINAFEQITKKSPSNGPKAHYIIMSSPPVLVDIVKERNIPNVHFLPPSGDEKDVWAFHYALDALAHFRLDGESFGLNIAESMIAGNPILTHKSHIWNAHLEFLNPSFTFISEKDDVNSYAKNMSSIIDSKVNNSIVDMKNASFSQGCRLFLIENSIKNIEDIITHTINK